MRRTIITALLAALALTLTPLVAPAGAVPPSPNHTVLQVLGRRLAAYAPDGNIDLGHVSASAQGEVIDSNDNGIPNGLRGPGALLERHGVQRLRMYSIQLQVFAETWQTVAIDDSDVVVSGVDAYLVNYTPVPGFCPQDIDLTYRVVHKDGIRWDDGRLRLRTTVSNQFQARAVANTQVC